MELTPGTVLGHYEVVGPADDSPRPSRFVIQERSRRTLHEVEVLERLDAQTRTRLLNEAAAQTRLRHANILAVTEILELDNGVGLVTAHVEGIPLSEVLTEGEPLARPDALRLFGQMCDALNAAHAQGIVHRGLDLDSILVVVDGDRADARVTRFGRAALARERSPSMASTGFTAPELLRDPKLVDPRIDVFSLGALLYELLCGYPAFRQADERKAADAILHARYRPITERLHGFPANAAALVHKALARDPGERFPTVRDLQKAAGAASAALLAPPLRRAEPGENTSERFPDEDTKTKPGILVARGEGRSAPVAQVRFDAPEVLLAGDQRSLDSNLDEATQVVPSARLAAPAAAPRPMAAVPQRPVEAPVEPPRPVPRVETPRVESRPPEPTRAPEPARSAAPAPSPTEPKAEPPKPAPKQEKKEAPPPEEGPSWFGRLLPLFLVLFVVASIGGTVYALASGAAGRMETAQAALRTAGAGQVAAWNEVGPVLATVTGAAHDSVSLGRAVDAFRDANKPSERVDTGEAAFRELQREASRQGGGNPTPQVGAALERVLEANKAYSGAFVDAKASEEGIGAELALSFGLVDGRVETVRPPALPPLSPAAPATP